VSHFEEFSLFSNWQDISIGYKLVQLMELLAFNSVSLFRQLIILLLMIFGFCINVVANTVIRFR
jgi:hypothetical protein